MLISGDSCVRVWNQQNASLTYTFDVGLSKINNISFTRDGRILFVASDTNRIQVIDLYKTENPPELTISHPNKKVTEINAIGCSSDGQLVGFGTSTGVINIFNTVTYEKVFSSAIHKAGITSICFHPSTNYIIASDTIGKISFSSLDKKVARILPTWSSSKGKISEFDSSPHKPLLAIACRSGIIFYDLTAMKIIKDKFPEFPGLPTHVRFSPSDANIVAFTSNVNNLYFYNDSSKSLSSPISFEDSITSIDFRNDGVFLAVSFAKTGVVVIDVRDSSIQHKYCTDNTNSTFVVRFQPVDINEDPKFKQTIIADLPKITKPNIQSSKSSDSKKNIVEKKKINTFSRVAQQKKPKIQPKIAKLNDKKNDVNFDDEDNDDNEIISDDKIEQNFNTNADEEPDVIRKKPLRRPDSADDNIQNIGSPVRKKTDSPRSPIRKIEPPKEKQQTSVHSSPIHPPPQKKQNSVPTNAPQIIKQEDESDDDDDLDLSKVPAESREMVKVICNYMKEMNEATKEELHQHLNEIHLNLLCKIREIDDKLNVLMQKMNVK